MARKEQYNFDKESRVSRIKKCQECHGAPNTDTTNLQGMVTEYCTTCMQVVDWHKIGDPIKIKEKITVTQGSGGSAVTTQLEGERTPGINFGELKLIK